MKKPTKNVFFIGLLSFFGGISQDIFAPILPLYLANVIGLDKAFIGISEGLVTSGASLFKIVSGFWVDKFGKKKPFIFLGYFLSMIARPLLAVISSAGGILFLRFLDGIGKGLKDSPKDALIADSSDASTRGKSFGIARMLDTFGSVAGPLVLFLLLYILKDHPLQYQIILVACAFPLLITLTLLQTKVKETSVKMVSGIVSAKTIPDTIFTARAIPKKFYIFLAIVLLFGIGNSSDAFLILRAQDVGVTILAIPLVFALFNAVYASASVPLGSLSDRIGREKVILLGWCAYAIAYLGFGLANASYQIWLLFAFYGLYYATTYGVAKAFVADMVPATHRGRAYGIYNTAIGLVSLPASFIAGLLWDRVSPSAPFLFGAVLAALATLCFIVFIMTQRRTSAS
ncbi:MFS transporter [Candidatus Uhrbacteria bacterium]|nr:MFS transporter [Candidatus Uhrbacteria bacterium]